jgi:hypothetical protein
VLYREWDNLNRRWETKVQVATIQWNGHQAVAQPVAGSPFLLARVGLGRTVQQLIQGQVPEPYHFINGDTYAGDFTQLTTKPKPGAAGQDLFAGTFATLGTTDRLAQNGTGTGLWHGTHLRRRTNAAGTRLRNADDTQDVEPSIDPFYFEVDPN